MTDERGFTLIELLVTVTIIGLLAAIAIPVFIGQRRGAQDASAKSMTRNASAAAEAFAVDHNESYVGAGTPMAIEDLRTIESSLRDGDGVELPAALVGVPTSSEYTATTKSKSGVYFSLTRNQTTGTTIRCRGQSAPSAACTGTSRW